MCVQNRPIGSRKSGKAARSGQKHERERPRGHSWPRCRERLSGTHRGEQLGPYPVVYTRGQEAGHERADAGPGRDARVAHDAPQPALAAALAPAARHPVAEQAPPPVRRHGGQAVGALRDRTVKSDPTLDMHPVVVLLGGQHTQHTPGPPELHGACCLPAFRSFRVLMPPPPGASSLSSSLAARLAWTTLARSRLQSSRVMASRAAIPR